MDYFLFFFLFEFSLVLVLDSPITGCCWIVRCNEAKHRERVTSKCDQHSWADAVK